jgi:hypothetical protein
LFILLGSGFLVEAPEAHRTRLNPGRDECGPFLSSKRDVLCILVRTAYKVPPDVIHVILVLYEKERGDLTHETRTYMFLFPADFTKFIVV